MAKKLNQSYDIMLKSWDKRNPEKVFFNNFPNNYNEFIALYGFNNDTPAILYDKYVDHVMTIFNNIKYVNDTAYYRKIINISAGAKWEVDAVECLQDGLCGHVLKNVMLATFILRNYSDKEIRNFWIFYFDGYFPKKEIPLPLQKIKEIDTSIYAKMMKSHDEVLARRKGSEGR